MAYEIKYRVTIITQAGVTMRLDMLEDSYAGAIIEYPATNFQLQYIPSSDDPFEPIYASQLAVGIDVTDDVSNMPDFTTLNDRKYLCKLYAANVLEWQGWGLSDSVGFAFTTGRKEITFNAICGLGILDKITFSQSNLESYFTYKSLIYCISKALGDIGINSDLFASVSIYSASMNDRTDAAYFDPFQQSYIQLSGIIENNEYITSYELLKNILISFGCRIFYAKGRWNILQINQQAEATPYYTLYDSTGTVTDSGTFADVKNVPTNMIFIGGDQTKIMRKGFNNIISQNKISYPENYIWNANLKTKSLISPYVEGWTFQNSGAGSGGVIIKENQEFDYWDLGKSGMSDFASIECSPFLIAKNDVLNISFEIVDSSPSTSPTGDVTCIMAVRTAGTSQTYYISDSLVGDKKGRWELQSGPITDYYQVKEQPIRGNFSFDSFPTPITGLVNVGFRLTADTGFDLLAGDFKLTVKSPFKEALFKSEITLNKEYTKKIEFPFGVNSNVLGKFSYKGFISDVDGNMMVDWYNFERPTDTYYSLAILMVKNYVIQFRKNIINIDANIEGLNSGFTRTNFDDSDPAQINVSSKKYLIGNTTINYNVNEGQSTLLEVSNTDQAVTITQKYFNLTDGTEPATGCVDAVSYEVVVDGDVAYSTCEGVGVVQNSGGIGPNVITDCMQYGTLIPYYGNGTPATIENIAYGGPCG